MPLYLCVDCGGTKTAAAISDESGNVVGRGSGGPSNITYLSLDGFISAVKKAVGTALRQSDPSARSLPPPEREQGPFVAAWFGISGADFPVAIAKVEQPLAELLGIPIGPDLVIANDTHLLAAPVRVHRDVNHAVAVIAGTGSNVVSFKEVEGKIVELGRVGGWGWMLGDEGGGYDVGREALRQILLVYDKSSVTGASLPKSRLIDSVLKRFGVDNIMEIFGGVYSPDPFPPITGEQNALQSLPREKRISSLSPLVFEAAFDHGDPLALNILRISAGKLASQITILLGGDSSSPDNIVKASESVVCFGGSLVGIEKYRDLLLQDLAQRGHVFRHVVFIDDAAASGAAGLAKLYTSS